MTSSAIGNRKDLEFNIPAAKIQRTNMLGLPQRIVYISSDERKRLGNNSSTLWHQMKELDEGKKTKVYRKVARKV
jgi:hypothetical protein